MQTNKTEGFKSTNLDRLTILNRRAEQEYSQGGGENNFIVGKALD